MLNFSKLRDEPAITLAFAGAAYAARSSSAWLVGLGAAALWWLWESEIGPSTSVSAPAPGQVVNFVIPGMRESTTQRYDRAAVDRAVGRLQAAVAENAPAPAPAGGEGRIGVSVNDGGLAGLSIGARRNPGLGSN